ncbi:MAG: sugar ABC transporter ATP-binding protein [Myxococcota bacterium]
MTALLEVARVTKSFGRTRALEGVSLSAAAGAVTAVLGENGAGKSTLMQILAGALRPDGGEIFFDGRPYRPRSPRDGAEAGIAMVHQEAHVCPELTVAENIALGREPRHGPFVSRRVQRRRAGAVIERLVPEGLDPDRSAGELSVGDRQFVCIARALSYAPRLLILDEPTSALTRVETERLFTAIARLQCEGIAILYISHFLEEVERLADRYVVLRDGSTVGDGRMGDRSLDDIVALMAGASVAAPSARTRGEPGGVVLEATALAGTPLPTAASLFLRRGEVLGIGGLIGAGRSELLRAIFGLDTIASGSLSVHGLTRTDARPRDRWAQGMGFLSEDRKGEGLADQMSVSENVTLAEIRPLLSFRSPREKRAAARRLIDAIRIKTTGPDAPVSSLSGGNQQKVALARLLHQKVDILVLDEPTRGVDVRSRNEIHALIDRLAAEGAGVLIVSSYLPELFALADRIQVMTRGVLGPSRPVAEASPTEVLREATGA